MDTNLSIVDLAMFTGRDSAEYTSQFGSWFAEALSQAEDLLTLATGFDAMPESALDRRIAVRGVLAMTEALLEGQASRDLRFSPFRSETIGSYVYTLNERVASGIPTGISWFDLAVTRLSVVPTISNDAISVYDRPGDIVTVQGRRFLPGPNDDRDGELGPGAQRMYGQAGHL